MKSKEIKINSARYLMSEEGGRGEGEWFLGLGFLTREKLHIQTLTGAPSLRFQHLSLSVISFRKLCKSLKNQEIVILYDS